MVLLCRVLDKIVPMITIPASSVLREAKMSDTLSALLAANEGIRARRLDPLRPGEPQADASERDELMLATCCASCLLGLLLSKMQNASSSGAAVLPPSVAGESGRWLDMIRSTLSLDSPKKWVRRPCYAMLGHLMESSLVNQRVWPRCHSVALSLGPSDPSCGVAGLGLGGDCGATAAVLFCG